MPSVKEELYRSLLIKKKLRGLDDLYFFNKFVIEDNRPERQKFLVPHVHSQWTSWFSGSSSRIRLVLVPRSTFKTSFFTIGWTLQQIAKNRNIRVLIANATLANAQRMVGEIKEHVQKNETFKLLYGDMYDKRLKWNEDELVVKGRDRGIREATVTAVGVGGNLVSQHYDIIIADDLVNSENSATRYQADKVIDWWRKSLSLLEPTGTNLIIGTRWSYYELYSYLLDEMKDKVDSYVRGAYNPNGSFYFPERFSGEKLIELKELHGSYIFCNPYEAPVLMDDWTTKPIGEVKAGEKVIGWKVTKTGRRTLCPVKVLETGSRKAGLVKLHLKSGRKIRCTPNHRWWTQRFEKGRKEYAPAKVGKRLRFVVDPYLQDRKLTKKQKELALWLGGLFDGDGGFSGSTIFFAQDKKHNPQVCKRIEYALTELGYDWNSSVRPQRTSKIRGREVKMSTEMQTYWINGGIETKRRFIFESNPSKKDKIAEKMFRHGGRFVRLKDEVIKITDDKVEDVYALQTETGNYIVWGYASSNSSFYLNNPVDEDTALIKKSMIKYYDKAPENLEIFTCIDPAISQRTTADYTGMVTVGIDWENNWYVLEARRGKWTVGEMIEEIFSAYDRLHPTTMSIEVIGQAQALLEPIHNEEEKRNLFLPLTEIKARPPLQKERRIRATLQPRFENGKIFIKKSMSDLEEELIHFPKSKHNDLIDSMADVTEIGFAPGKEEKKEAEPKSNLERRLQAHFNKKKVYVDEIMGENY